jgi:hypothetical protein
LGDAKGEGEDGAPAGWCMLEKKEGDQNEECEEGDTTKEEKRSTLLTLWWRKKVVVPEEVKVALPLDLLAWAELDKACLLVAAGALPARA